jgi:hypothetical protein
LVRSSFAARRPDEQIRAQLAELVESEAAEPAERHPRAEWPAATATAQSPGLTTTGREGTPMTTIPSKDPIAVALGVAVRAGDLRSLAAMLDERPELTTARFDDGRGTRTSLHLVTDWPGFFANGPATARALLAAGADVNARTTGRGRETPLHWTASSDDADVAAVLIDAGADLDAPDGSIGTPLANAVGYGCWHVATLLVARGAVVEAPWQAAALGLLDRVEELTVGASAEEISHAFWQACHGGRRRAAELLLARGADRTWRPGYADQSALEVARSLDTERENLIEWLGRLDA